MEWTAVTRSLGWVTSKEEAEAVRQSWQREHSLTFVMRRSWKKGLEFRHFSSSSTSGSPSSSAAGLGSAPGPSGDNFRIRYQSIDNVVPDDGVPFVITSTAEYHCVFGPDQHRSEKIRKAASRDHELKGDHPRPVKSRTRIQTTKKKGCPAKILMREVIRFPDFKPQILTPKVRKTSAACLRRALLGGQPVRSEHRIYIKLPEESEHSNHVIGELSGVMNTVDKRVAQHIDVLVREGTRSVAEVKRHLITFVQTQLCKDDIMPRRSDAAFYPTDTVIRNHMYEARMKLRFCSKNETREKRIKMDSDYFKSYEDIGIHEEMIRDEVRTNSYRLAILRASDKLIGKAVADVGAGTGILSCFCHQAGASRVYAIEASSMAEQAQKVVQANGASGKVQVIRGRVEDVDLPEKVDAIVSEWMGHFLLYESMLNSVIHARDKWLKEGGLLLPNKANLYLAPFTNESFYTNRITFWDGVKEKFGVDMACVADHARSNLCRRVHVEEVDGAALLARECALAELDLQTLTAQDLECVQAPFSFSCFGMELFCGFTAWFTVAFDTGSKTKEAVTISTAPDKLGTHWQQCSMYLEEPIHVQQDTAITGTIKLTPGKRNRRFLDVELTFQVDNGQPVTRHYSMEDGST